MALQVFLEELVSVLVDVERRLAASGYRFRRSDPVGPVMASEIEEMRPRRSRVPEALWMLWERVGQVDLVGSWPDGLPIHRLTGAPIDQVMYADPLVVYGPARSFRDFVGATEVRVLDLGPDACVKAGYGGGEPMTVDAGSGAGADPRIHSPDWPPGTTLCELLCESMRWYGLPGLRKYPAAGPELERRLGGTS